MGSPPREAHLRVIVKGTRHLSRVEVSRVRPARVNSATSPRTTCGRRVIRRADGAAGFRLPAGCWPSGSFVRDLSRGCISSPPPRVHSGKIVRNHRPKRRVHDPRNFPIIFSTDPSSRCRPRRRRPRFACRVPCRTVAVSRAMREGFANFCTTSRECAGARRSLSPLRRVDPPPSVFPRFASSPLASLGSTLLSVASFLLTFSWRTGRPTCTSSRLWFGTTPSRWFSRRRRPWCTERSPGPRRRR